MATPDYSGGLSSAISPDSKSSRSAATVVPPYSAAVGGVASGQMAREMGAFVPGGAPRLAGATRARAACARMRAGKREEGAGRGLLGKLRDALVRPIVAVPGGAKANAQLLDCVFCKGSGRNECTGCRGSGRDALGKCLMCDGWKRVECHVCSGVGLVDRVRRGGTDDRNEYVPKRKPGK